MENKEKIHDKSKGSSKGDKNQKNRKSKKIKI